MSDKDKMYIINLLVKEYEKTKNMECVRLIRIINNANYVFQNLYLNYNNIKKINTDIDLNNILLDNIVISNSDIKFTVDGMIIEPSAYNIERSNKNEK